MIRNCHTKKRIKKNQTISEIFYINPLSANSKKWSNRHTETIRRRKANELFERV